MKGGGVGLLAKYHDTQKFGCGVMLKCLLSAVVVISLFNPALLPTSIFQSEYFNRSILPILISIN